MNSLSYKGRDSRYQLVRRLQWVGPLVVLCCLPRTHVSRRLARKQCIERCPQAINICVYVAALADMRGSFVDGRTRTTYNQGSPGVIFLPDATINQHSPGPGFYNDVGCFDVAMDQR